MTEKQADQAPSRSPAISVVDATKRYGELVALDDVSFEVPAGGGVVGVLGSNGAGKSTLFRAMLSLTPLDAGSVAIHGFDVWREGALARRDVGYLPEHLKLYERLTGGELLGLVAGLKQVDCAEQQNALLEQFGMTAQRDILIGNYSLGMRKKIGLIVALSASPRLVLLDEPLNGLDTVSMRTLRLEMDKMVDAGTTFVVSSHVMAFVERVCHRLIVLRRGRIVADGDVAELRRLAAAGSAPSGEKVPFEDVFLQLALGD